jgi:integrase
MVLFYLLQLTSSVGLVDPLKFRLELLQATTESQARRTLMQLSAACKWGIKHKLIEDNPFDGMYLELSATKPVPPISFTVQERDQIIAAFETDSRPGINYRHYAPFVKFLFWSGCRPCEAIGLRLSSVNADYSIGTSVSNHLRASALNFPIGVKMHEKCD